MAGVKGRSGRKANEPIITQNLIIALNQADPKAPGRKRMLGIIEALLKKAEGGDVQAINTVLERVEGKVPQKNENTHAIEGKLELVKRIANS